MKRLIKASSDGKVTVKKKPSKFKYLAYGNVDKFLKDMFNVNYSDYKNKSPMISTPYGDLEYVIYTMINHDDQLVVNIYLSERQNMVKLVDDIDKKKYNVTYTDPKYGQVNVKFDKIFAYDVYNIEDMIKATLINLGLTHPDVSYCTNAPITTDILISVVSDMPADEWDDIVLKVCQVLENKVPDACKIEYETHISSSQHCFAHIYLKF